VAADTGLDSMPFNRIMAPVTMAAEKARRI